MSNELIRVVATIRVQKVDATFDYEDLATDIAEYLQGTAIRNAGLAPHPQDPDARALTHVHVSTMSDNCEACMRHAMDEEN